MKVEVLRTFQLSGSPPHFCGEKFTVPDKVGKRLVREGLVREIKEPRKPRRKRSVR